MKSIATLSDQYIGLQFRKDNGLPIDPTSIHFKGKVYTNPNTPFEFEINKGVLTNCVIKYNLVILHIVPNFKSGIVSIEGNRFTTPEDILGKYIKQELDISITTNADVRNLQDYAIADVILYGDDIATQTIDPNEIKSIVDKYLALNLKGIVSPIIQNELSADVTNAVTKAINDNLPNDISTEIAKVLSNKVDSEIAKQLLTKLDDAKEFAIVLYPAISQIPTTLIINDFEGDIIPSFNHVFIISNEHDDAKIIENQKGYIKTTCYTPKGMAALRYTCNSTDTKVPIGKTVGDKNIINDNSWQDAGAYDPDKLQGDYKFLVDGKVESAEYGFLVRNEQATVNNVEFWWAKVNGDGSFTETPNSRTATTIEANRVNPKIVMSNPFSFDVAKNDRVAVFMKSDKNDGFYIESTTDGKPFYWSTLVFDEEKEIPKNIVDLIEQNGIQFTKAGKPVDNPDKYSISIDVDTNKITVVTK